jgi:hypothetical protein
VAIPYIYTVYLKNFIHHILSHSFFPQFPIIWMVISLKGKGSCNLSLADICFISVMVPNKLMDLQNTRRVISCVDCVTQMSLFIIFGCMNSLLITVMAYDWFVAICHTLHYSVIMNPQLCAILVLVSFLFGLLDSQVHNFIFLQFSYQRSRNF